MNKVSEFFINHFENHVCDNCERHFPRSVLIRYNSPFKEVDGLYCTVCMHKVYDLLGYCDECGEECPKKQLYISVMDKATICKRCLQNEDKE